MGYSKHDTTIVFAIVLIAFPLVVIQPSRRASVWKREQKLMSWTDYFALFDPETPWRDDPRALRLLSSAYSYALTLCKFLPDLMDKRMVGSRVELHVIGARAEAMMPRYLWDELAFFDPDRVFDIKLVGDHVPVMSARRKTLLRERESERVRLEMVSGLYHELEPGSLGTPDAFVLYNPGIGHPQLREKWAPTLETVLLSCKPVLITSFSLDDQQRDIAALHGLVATSQALKQHEVQFRCRAKRNPFRSLKHQPDPANVSAPIQTNSRVMVMQLVHTHKEEVSTE